jgi:hypothetical protein
MEEQLKKDSSSTYSSNKFFPPIIAQHVKSIKINLVMYRIEKQLIAIIQDLAIAGFHTSSSTIGKFNFLV